MDYSVGDRVEVLWHQKLYTAEVRAVYANGKVDVMYDADNSAGYLLSEAEHGLNKMWMPKKKGKGATTPAIPKWHGLTSLRLPHPNCPPHPTGSSFTVPEVQFAMYPPGSWFRVPLGTGGCASDAVLSTLSMSIVASN